MTFHVGGQRFGTPIEQVRETIEMRPITPVFRMPAMVAGLTNLRGESLAVLDMAIPLGFGPCRRDPTARIVVVDIPLDDAPDEGRRERGGRSAGLLVDGLGPIRSIHPGDIGPVPATLPAAEAAFLRGVVSLADHPLPILDLSKVLGAPALRAYVSDPTQSEGTAPSRTRRSLDGPSREGPPESR